MNRVDFCYKCHFILSLAIIAFGQFMAIFNQSTVFDLFNRQNVLFKIAVVLATGMRLAFSRKAFVGM